MILGVIFRKETVGETQKLLQKSKLLSVFFCGGGAPTKVLRESDLKQMSTVSSQRDARDARCEVRARM